MTAMSDLSVAVVGTGFIGGVHLDALRRLGVRIAGVVGSSPERGRQGAAALGVAHSYESFEDMLADRAVDVVHITSPNDTHSAQVEAALRVGKHVICEKPLALTSRDTDRLRRLARESGLVAAVNFNIRFYPHVHEMRARIRDGELGALYLLTGTYLQDWLLNDTDWNWRVDSQRGGDLRVVGDIGSHWFDLVTFVTGQRIVEVMAELPTFVPVRRKPTQPSRTFSSETADESVGVEITSEDAALIMVRFEGGARGILTASQVSAGHKNSISLEVNGARSSVAWRGERPDELWIGHREEPNQLVMRDPSLLTAEAAAVSVLPGGHIEGFQNSFAAMYRAIYADVAVGRPSPCPSYANFDDGHEEALIVEAAALSAETSSWTAVDRT